MLAAEMEFKMAKLSFEQSMKELEDVLKKLEGGELPLEQAIGEFERGISLVKKCQGMLNDAEQKVMLLLQKDGETVLEPFGENG